eukprot:TRINITY_DN3517_c0_g1_i1.p1 TRINITY_DN3517_c0_g1~~TRINITY_DN3517_c0_g1_i1.p1  ORF type:complete len:100 (+),score=5.96 TRINITY_DN3517_c0_g1_i1:295-594(+)
MFLFTLFQYIGVLLVFNKSKPFRKPIYTNFWFSFTAILAITFSLHLLLRPITIIQSLFQMLEIPLYWSLYILVAGIVYVIVAFAYEAFVMSLLKCSRKT